MKKKIIVILIVLSLFIYTKVDALTNDDINKIDEIVSINFDNNYDLGLITLNSIGSFFDHYIIAVTYDQYYIYDYNKNLKKEYYKYANNNSNILSIYNNKLFLQEYNDVEQTTVYYELDNNLNTIKVTDQELLTEFESNYYSYEINKDHVSPDDMSDLTNFNYDSNYYYIYGKHYGDDYVIFETMNNYTDDSELAIYDKTGNKIKTLIDDPTASIHSIEVKDNKILVGYKLLDLSTPNESDETPPGVYYTDYLQKYYVSVFDIVEDENENEEDVTTINLNNTQYRKLSSFFKNPDSIQQWIVENPEILKIEDDNIVPLKTGKTDIIGIGETRSYRLRVNIIENREIPIINPETMKNVLPLIIIAISIIIYSITDNYIKKENKQYEKE